jgi:DUF1009 family protein
VVDHGADASLAQPRGQRRRVLALGHVDDGRAGAARAGLAGIAVEASACLILDREAVIAAALGAGLFVVGV